MPDSAISLISSNRTVKWLVIAAGLLTLLHLFEQSFHHARRPLNITKTSFDWSTLNPYHPVSSLRPLPSKAPQKLRRVQHTEGKPHRYDIGVEQSRCKTIKAVAERVWSNYTLQDETVREQAPLNGGLQDPFSAWGETLINSLDTLWIMGMKKEFQHAVRTVGSLDWSATRKKSIIVRETTTRYLGGLLGAYDLSGEPVLLAKAQELGDLLHIGFDTPTHLAPFTLDFEKARNGLLEGDEEQDATSLAGLCLEFTRLSQVTGDEKYYDTVVRITDQLGASQNMTKLPGLWPSTFSGKEAIYNHENVFTLGTGSGRMYHSLLKMHSLLGAVDERYEEMYRNASARIIEKLFFRPMTPKNLDVVFPGTYRVGDKVQLDPEITHSACFAGGMLALAGRLFNITAQVNLGARLTNGCMWAYGAFPHGIMPESFKTVPCPLDGCKWEEEKWLKAIEHGYEERQDLPMGFVSSRDPSYNLRPETLESIFVMYRITGHQEYREAAWKIFQAIQEATETEDGNVVIADATTRGTVQHRELAESVWLGSTLKYLYLIFSPQELVSLDRFVFNAEGHPMKLPKG